MKRVVAGLAVLTFGVAGGGVAVPSQVGAVPNVPTVPSQPTKDEGGFVSPSVERAMQGGEKGSSAKVRVIVTFEATRSASGGYRTADVRRGQANALAGVPASSYRIVSEFDRLPAVALEVTSASLDALRTNPAVRAINLDQVVRTTMDEANAITGVASVHSGGATGDGVTVAIIDTGVDSAGGTVHPALADDLVGQACFRTENDCIGGATSAEDQDGHGTHVAGIITGPSGVAPDANFYALKVFTTGDTSDTNILNALDYVLDLNTTTPGTIDVINMSLGGDLFADQATCDANSTAYVDAFAALNAQGVSVFVATGNDAETDRVGSPACATGAIGVGSTGDGDHNIAFGACTDVGAVDKVSCYSNATPVQGAGELVDLLAPGCTIVSTGLDESVDYELCGTSMATPYAAGSAALLLEYLADTSASMTPAQLEAHMELTGKQVADYRMAVDAPTFPRVSPQAMIGALALDAPLDFTITGTSTTEVSTSWTAVAEATEYRVYASVDGGLPALAGTVAAPATTFADTAPACGELTYFVRAFDGSFESVDSNTDTTTARPCPLAASDLTLTPTASNGHDLTWTDTNPDETAGIVQRRVNGSAWADYWEVLPGSAMTFSETGLACGVYEYRVLAERGVDRSAPSNVVERGVCAPANDNFANAQVITPDTPFTDTEPDQSYGTEEATDPIYSCHFGGAAPGFQGVWYSITPTVATRVTASTALTDIFAQSAGVPDTLAAIFTGTPGNFTTVACNDDISGSNFRSSVTSNLSAGTTYYVFVSQWVDLPPGTTGDLVVDFTWSAPTVIPDNDLVANARVVNADPYTNTVTSAQNATTSPTDLPHSCASNAAGTGILPRVGTHTVWWSFTPAVDGEIDLDTLSSSGSFNDTILTVYTGTSGSFTEVGCNDDEQSAGVSLRSEILDLSVEGGTTYTIYVSRWNSTPTASAGTVVLDLDFTATPAVVVSPTVVDVTEGGATDTYDVVLATPPVFNTEVFFTGDDDCDVEFTSVLFTPADWDTPRTVMVTAVDDVLPEGPHSCEITHSVTSGDPDYDGVAVDSVTGAVTDRVIGAGVSVDRGTPTPIDEPGGEFTFMSTIANTSEVAITIDSITESGTTGGTCAALESLVLGASDGVPGGADEVTCFSTVTHTDAGTYPASISVDVSNAFSTTDSASAEADAVVNDAAPNSSSVVATLTATPSSVPATGGSVLYELTVQNGPTEPLTIDSLTISTSPGSAESLSAVDCADAVDTIIPVNGLFECSFTATRTGVAGTSILTHVDLIIADDENNTAPVTASASVAFTADPAVVVTPTWIDVAEGAAGVEYELVLASEPTSDVTVSVADDAQCEVDVLSVVFTPANWGTPRTVTVTAVDDLLAEGPHTCEITHSVTSGDGDYDGIAVDSVTGAVTDRVIDAGVSVNRSTPAALDEPGGEFSFTSTIRNTSEVAITIDEVVEFGTTGGNCAALESTVLAADDSAPGGADEVTCVSTVTHTDAGTYPASMSVDVSNAFSTTD
ncbi:MAG TPA: hypothetical protein DCR14_19495, partial [Acidimicrobiaceae bacterium]|nr:hypothetical protein [Acidimicrobiaceae bacterium]